MTTEKGNLTVPVAIIAAGLLIAAAVYFALGSGPQPTHGGYEPEPTPTTPIAGVQADDHIKGSPDAKIVIVEYSDTECPFCKEHHSTLNQVIEEYDPSEVAWVYRNFPLPQLHAKAQTEAEALECAAELGGNDAFWEYTDTLYEATPSNDGLDLAELPNFAEAVGLDRDAFTQCLESGDMAARVQADVDEAWAAGAQGTPHNVILVNGEQIPMPGMMRFADIKPILDQFLAE